MTNPNAPTCATTDEHDAREWIECWQCFGEGATEDCFEDCCVCLNPPCYWNRCDVCEGKGGWYAAPTDDGAGQ